MRYTNRQFGFTLIELLLSLSILSIIIVIIFGALRITVRAWEKGEKMLTVQQRSRTLLDQLDRQLSSSVVLMADQEEQPLVAFAGTEHSVEFTSSLPLNLDARFAPVHVKYLVEKESGGKTRLLFYEKSMTIEDYIPDPSWARGADDHVLTDDFEDLRFEYLDGAGNLAELNWSPSWSPGASEELPRAVRITAGSAEDGNAIKVIARMNLWARFRQGVQ